MKSWIFINNQNNITKIESQFLISYASNFPKSLEEQLY